MPTPMESDSQRILLDDLEEPVAPLTGAIDGSDLDAPLPLTIIMLIVLM